MNYKIIIDILDNSQLSYDISNRIYQQLLNNNYDVLLLDNNISLNEKITTINQYENNTIVISNQLNNDNTTEIIYSLYFDNILPLLINDELNNILNVTKFYQLRSPADTSQDYYEIIRETPNAESIIIRYQSNATNNVEQIVENLYKALNDYIKGANIYTVQSGDSLYKIANKYNITVNDLKEANGLSNNNLTIGQKLIIPKKEKEEILPDTNAYQTYIVKQGDSLYKIANNFNTSVNEIKTLNNLTSNNLSIGQVLQIPNQIKDNFQTYIVKQGDSLYKIANNFNTTTNYLIEINNLTSTNLSIGQQLIVPNNNENKNESNQLYTVKAGDSLYKIANNFNTTINEIKILNNLTSNNLSIGQILKIPNQLNENFQTYTVKAGDSLYKIANNFNTTINEIKTLNNLTSNNLSIGQILLIP